MEFQGIEKLRGTENWCIWKFAVRNILRGTEGAYEVCTGKLNKPEKLAAGANETQKATYEAALKV